MKIPRRIAQKKLQLKALRLLAAGFCVAVFSVVLLKEHSQIFLFLFAALAATAALLFTYSLVKNYPDQNIELTPDIKLPNSVIVNGLDCSKEPITFWVENSIFKNMILLTTDQRFLAIYQADVGKLNWDSLLRALPKELKGKEVKAPINMMICAFGLFCGAAHLTLQSNPFYLSQVDAFNAVASGAYNYGLVAQGEIYRILSYSWLHANELHLCTNLIALVLIAQAIGIGFRRATLGTVAILSTLFGALAGSLFQNFELTIGASGTVMGLFGFLFAAQRKKDVRLHPYFRFSKQKLLYLVLAAEFILSVKYKWYGGSIHLAGFASGYALYILSAKSDDSPRWRPWKMRIQFTTILAGSYFFASWVLHSYNAIQQPQRIVESYLASEDSFLTLIASTALPDLKEAKRVDVIEVRKIAHAASIDVPAFSWPVARAEYWLGNNQNALLILRKLTSKYPDSEPLRELWLAVELVSAKERQLKSPLQTIPTGPGTAYLISANYQQLARLKLNSKSVPIEQALISKPAQNWHLLSIAATLEDSHPGTYGAWLIPNTQFRTAANANIAAGLTN